jgi:predicted negative regulator of RcsB-dependent stress response
MWYPGPLVVTALAVVLSIIFAVYNARTGRRRAQRLRETGAGVARIDEGTKLSSVEGMRAQLARLKGAGVPEDSAETLAVRHALARALQDEGSNAEAEKEFRAVLALVERGLGAESGEAMMTRHNLARVLQEQGQLDQGLILSMIPAWHHSYFYALLLPSQD